MPGRQAHGRSLTQQPSKPKNRGKASKARSQQNALNAFNIAQEHFPAREKKTPRFRGLDAEIERKHARDDNDDDEEGDEDDEDQPPKRKKARPTGDGDGDYGSDSEGNEWRLGGMMDDDNDSEIESDDAFGDSDNEKFDEYTFRGSKSKSTSKKANDSDSGDDEGDSEDEEGETLGAEAIDLATALDQWEEESEAEPKKRSESGSDSEESSSADSDDEESDEDEDSASDADDEPDADKLEALKGLVSGFGDKDAKAQQAPTKHKIDLGDLGLTGIDDPYMKNSVNLMKKETNEKRPSKKLDIPLSRREQGRLDRSAAYDKTNETLSRWNDTVKANRRAEHLSFPLAVDTGKAGLDKTSFQPIKAQPAGNDHEASFLSLLDEAGLTEQPQKEKEKVYDDDGNELTRKEIVAKKRIERERAARETKRAARIKKIKSKAYRRVHRKQGERDAAAEEDGEVDSEAEREAADRRRALERVGQRHKESKWAKMGAKNKRAVWDDDFRAGLGEMARKDEELRRRKEGKTVDSDDETSSSGSDSEEEGGNFLQKVRDALEDEEETPQNGIMGMKFMRNAENARRQMEKDELERIKRDEEEMMGIVHPENDDQEVGRRTYGGKPNMTDPKPSLNEFEEPEPAEEDDGDAPASKDKEDKPQPSSQTKRPSSVKNKKPLSREPLPTPSTTEPEATAQKTVGGWSTKGSDRKHKSKSTAEAIDPTTTSMALNKPPPPKKKKQQATTSTTTDPEDSDDDLDSHLPLAIRDQELIDRTFAGDDVVAEFEAEKNATAEADDDKVIDNTIPGWGSWVGEGVSAKEQRRNQGRFVTKVQGVKRKNRQDAKLDRVIINEKRNKKNANYLATQLPHPFESRQQYERAMRLPVGPEWQTKETFQDSTKPRVMMKQGVIAPIAKPH